MKKLLPLLLAVLTSLCLGGGALALDMEDPYLSSAEALHDLGLFQGTGTNADGTPIYDLDKTPSRNQALIMLVRLLGKEAEAKNGAWDIPFTDVSAEMKPYVGYAYANGLTTGYTAESFRGGQKVSGNQYVSFLLRALGYESGKDFEVAKATELSDKIGLTAGQSLAGFTRGDVAQLSAAALSTPLKDSETTMMRKLQTEGVIPAQAEVPQRPAGLLPEDQAPEGLEFHEIPYEAPYIVLKSYTPDFFTPERFEYAMDGEDVYFRVYFTSDTVGEFFVLMGNFVQTMKGMYLSEQSEMLRYAADAKSGVFTCKIQKSMLEQYSALYLSPTEDYKQGPDYVLYCGYFLTEDGEEPVFQPDEYYWDDSAEAPGFQFESLESAEVLSGRLYRLNFTNENRRLLQFWLRGKNESEGWKILDGYWPRPNAGDTSVLYMIPNCVLESDLNELVIRVRDNDVDADFHGYVFVYVDHEFPERNNVDSED